MTTASNDDEIDQLERELESARDAVVAYCKAHRKPGFDSEQAFALRAIAYTAWMKLEEKLRR